MHHILNSYSHLRINILLVLSLMVTAGYLIGSVRDAKRKKYIVMVTAMSFVGLMLGLIVPVKF